MAQNLKLFFEISFFVSKNRRRTEMDKRIVTNRKNFREQNAEKRNRDSERIRDEIRKFRCPRSDRAVEQLFQNTDKKSVANREYERDGLGDALAKNETRRKNEREKQKRNFDVREFIDGESKIESKNFDRRENKNQREKKIFSHFNAIEIQNKSPKFRVHFFGNPRTKFAVAKSIRLATNLNIPCETFCISVRRQNPVV